MDGLQTTDPAPEAQLQINPLDRLADRFLTLLPNKSGKGPRIPLDRAIYVELFFDLVFIFCAHSILPILSDAPDGNATWYAYYTFWFTFALMLQIWFNATLFMNRLGNGGIADTVYLLTTMFLLFVMMRAVSVRWEHYAIYNICWVLISINTIIHWMIRYRRIPNPSPQLRRDTRNAVLTLVVQVVLVLFSHLLPKNPAQVVCLVAMLIGFLHWYMGGREVLGHQNREHLTERCALLMILMFGEMLLGVGNEISTDLALFEPIMYFLLIVGMFLIYINTIKNLLNLDSIRGGMRYMALSAWLTFWLANVTASFKMMVEGITLMGVSSRLYFGTSVAVFLLSFFMFSPFGKYKPPAAKWFVARVVASLLVLAQMVVAEAIEGSLPAHMTLPLEAGSPASNALSVAMVIVAAAAVFLSWPSTAPRLALRSG